MRIDRRYTPDNSGKPSKRMHVRTSEEKQYQLITTETKDFSGGEKNPSSPVSISDHIQRSFHFLRMPAQNPVPIMAPAQEQTSTTKTEPFTVPAKETQESKNPTNPTQLSCPTYIYDRNYGLDDASLAYHEGHVEEIHQQIIEILARKGWPRNPNLMALYKSVASIYDCAYCRRVSSEL